MDFAVQRVRTSWTKQSRGGAAATVRNSAPVAFRLPPAPLPLLHAVDLTEADAFEPLEQVVELNESPKDLLLATGLRLTAEAGTLRVYPDLRYQMPPRRRRPPALRLAHGEWLRWQLNYRAHRPNWTAEWVYFLDTFNVAHGPVAPDTFLGNPPHLIEELGYLR